jgi:hypothetical protein
MQGLSHFLEHMLFMGSEKFPDENDYDSFLTHHGGASNAFTELVCVCVCEGCVCGGGGGALVGGMCGAGGRQPASHVHVACLPAARQERRRLSRVTHSNLPLPCAHTHTHTHTHTYTCTHTRAHTHTGHWRRCGTPHPRRSTPTTTLRWRPRRCTARSSALRSFSWRRCSRCGAAAQAASAPRSLRSPR